MGIHTFLKNICPKVNVIAQLEFELAYYDSAVQRFNHYTLSSFKYMTRVLFLPLLLNPDYLPEIRFQVV